MSKLFRCQNAECSEDPHGRLIFDFAADQPVCPKCKADGRKPEHRATIVKLEAIHYHVPDAKGPDAGFGKRRRVACMPCGPAATIRGKRASGEARAVTCPACKATAEWRAAADENDFATPGDLDFDVEIDRKVAVIREKEKDAADCGCK